MENGDDVDIFWSSAHDWERLSQREAVRNGDQGDEEDPFGLFSIGSAMDYSEGSRLLNDVLADSIFLLGLYKKHCRLTQGQIQPELEELLDRHAREVTESNDELAQCVHDLGGVAISDPRKDAEVATVPSASLGLEESPALLYRILEVHRIIIQKIRRVVAGIDSRDKRADRELMRDVLNRHEREAWLIAEQLVGSLTDVVESTPLAGTSSDAVTSIGEGA